MHENIGKNISNNVSGKQSQKLLDHAKQAARDALETALKRATFKAEEVTGDLIDNETAERITKFSKNLQQNSPETVTNDNGKKTPKDR